MTNLSAELILQRLRVIDIEPAARNIKLIRLASRDEHPLLPAEPGAHLTLALPNGIERQYSIIEASAAPSSYLLGVKRDPLSRGGSRYIFDELRVGDLITSGAPQNHFPLAEDSTRSVLIAGGIGITPIWSMVRRLTALGRTWKLIYACRSPEDALFLPEMEATGRAQVHFDQAGAALIDLKELCAAEPEGTDFYCCGPSAMLESFLEATADRPATRVHHESFSATSEPARQGGFTVELAKDGRSVFIAPGQSILDAVKALGIPAPYSCEQGVCGSCETTVLSGQPDHRDAVLTDAEKKNGDTMMICCSGALSTTLVLDI